MVHLKGNPRKNEGGNSAPRPASKGSLYRTHFKKVSAVCNLAQCCRRCSKRQGKICLTVTPPFIIDRRLLSRQPRPPALHGGQVKALMFRYRGVSGALMVSATPHIAYLWLRLATETGLAFPYKTIQW